MFVFKVHNSGRETLLAACDADLLGKELRDGDLKLSVTPWFYGDSSATPAQLLSQLRRCTIANLVGEKTIRVAIDAGLVEEANVLRIAGVPHAQTASMG